MPKPLFDKNDPLNGGDNGSGMHTSISLWNESSTTNIFYDSDDYYAELSQIGRYFIGGLIEHAHSLAAIVAPTINSYHRLIPGFEAPVYIAWAKETGLLSYVYLLMKEIMLNQNVLNSEPLIQLLTHIWHFQQ